MSSRVSSTGGSPASSLKDAAQECLQLDDVLPDKSKALLTKQVLGDCLPFQMSEL